MFIFMFIFGPLTVCRYIRCPFPFHIWVSCHSLITHVRCLHGVLHILRSLSHSSLEIASFAFRYWKHSWRQFHVPSTSLQTNGDGYMFNDKLIIEAPLSFHVRLNDWRYIHVPYVLVLKMGHSSIALSSPSSFHLWSYTPSHVLTTYWR